MKLYLKQKTFTIGDEFDVYDEAGKEKYHVEGEVQLFGKKLHIYSMEGKELCIIHKELFTMLPSFFIQIDGVDVANVKKDFTLFEHQYSISGFNWDVSGNFGAHEYEITSTKGQIATISKEWFTWGDAYEIDIQDDEDSLKVLSVVLVIDAVLASK